MTHEHAPISPAPIAAPGTVAAPAAKVTRRARAFTLIEILVVMGIIVVLVTLALPAFSFITGSRSGEAASNQLSSVLSIARSEAIGVQQIRGIAIYHDRDTDRAVASIVELRDAPFSVWFAGTSTNGLTHTYGEYVQNGAVTPTAYVCIQAHVDTGTITLTDLAYWKPLSSYNTTVGAQTPMIEFKANAEFMNLPTGIDVRAATNATTVLTVPYHYSSPAVFLFDANGQTVTREFRILREGLLGQRIDFNTASPFFATATDPYRASSGIGLVVYNADQFKNGTATFAVAAPTAMSVGQIENWLDQNATPAMLNRFNGTLVKGE